MVCSKFDEVPKNAKNTILWTLFVTPLVQHGKLDQTDAFSYYVGVGSPQQRLDQS